MMATKCIETEKSGNLCIISASDAENWVKFIQANISEKIKCYTKDVTQILMMPTVEDMNQLSKCCAIMLLITEEMIGFLKDNKSANFHAHITDTRKGIIYYLFTCEDHITNAKLDTRFPNFTDGNWTKLEYHQFSYDGTYKKNWLQILATVEQNKDLDNENATELSINTTYIDMERKQKNDEDGGYATVAHENDKLYRSYCTSEESKMKDEGTEDGGYTTMLNEKDSYSLNEDLQDLYLTTNKAVSMQDTDGYLKAVTHNIHTYENRQAETESSEVEYSYAKLPYPPELPYEYADLETLPLAWKGRPRPVKKNTFRVQIYPSELTKKCSLQEDKTYYLEIGDLQIILCDLHGKQLWRWPFNFIRRYGRNQNSFTLEAGRKCESGPGVFKFMCEGKGEEIFETANTKAETIRKSQQNQV